MAKRKRSLSREAIKFRTGEPLLYGSNWKLPRPQERVPRSVDRPLMPARRAGMPISSAKRFAVGVSSTPLSGNRKWGFSLSTMLATRLGAYRPGAGFFRQMQHLKSVGFQVRNPDKVLFCAKRKLRRSVLFAFRRVGFSGSSGGRRKTYRRNANSLHGC